jgi:hypothetical protein
MSEKPIYEYRWSNNEVRKRMKGRKCRILARGKMNTCMIKFLDNGQIEAVSRNSLRKVADRVQGKKKEGLTMARDINKFVLSENEEGIRGCRGITKRHGILRYCAQPAIDGTNYCWYHNPDDPHKFGDGYYQIERDRR